MRGSLTLSFRLREAPLSAKTSLSILPGSEYRSEATLAGNENESVHILGSSDGMTKSVL